MSDITVLEKGQSIKIADKAPSLKNLYIGIGWDTNKSGGADFDLDVTAALLNASGKVIDNSHLVYYGNLKLEENGVTVAEHSPDDLTGGASATGDDEFIKVKLDKLSPAVQSILVFVNIYDAKGRGQHFGDVESSFVRLADDDTQKEFARHELKKEFAGNSGVVLAEIAREGSDWKVKAVSEGINGSIDEILTARNLK